MDNPLLLRFKTKYQSVPFSKILPEHFIPAIKRNIEVSIISINKITNQSDRPTFENTIEPLQNISELLERNSSILFNINNAETSDYIQKTTHEASVILSKFQNDLRLNISLFERIKKVYQNRESENLTKEQLTLLKKEYKGFSRNGGQLSNKKKEILRSIDEKIAQLSLTFGENVLADSKAYTLQITDEHKLKGLPESIIEMAKETANRKNKKGWVFTLDYPIYIPFMSYMEDRSLRREMSNAFAQRGFQNNDHNNTKII